MRVLVFLLILFSELSFAISVTDDRGQVITLEKPAQRIISLAPHDTELLFAVGAGTNIVGAIEYSDYPPQALKIPRIGNAMRIDMERVLSMRPDLVVAWGGGNSKSDIQRLEDRGVTVFVTQAKSLTDISKQALALGVLTGNQAKAEQVVKKFRQELQQLAVTYSQRSKVSVFYQIWGRPLMTISGQHIISDAIRLCGGKNIFSDLSAIAPAVSQEAVMHADPEVIISGQSGSDSDFFADWESWKKLSAVQNKHLYVVSAELLSRATPRMLEGVQQLCELIQKVRDAGSNN